MFPVLRRLSQDSGKKSRELLEITAVVVTHRMATARYADRILVMDKKMIVSNGSFEELKKNCQIFQELLNLGMQINQE